MHAYDSALRAFATLGCAALTIGAGLCAHAQSFPSKPIHLITSFATGSSQDQVARILAEPLRERLGQPVVVENRAGGGGILGALHVAQATPDGHTLAIAGVGEMALVPATTPGLKYDPRRDFAPLSQIAELPFWIVTHPAFPARTVPDLLALARERPGKVEFATYSPGTIGFFGVELLQQMAGVRFLTIPYKSAAEAYPDVMSGRVPVFLDSVGASRGAVRGGKLTAVATTTASRLAEYPALPTIAESGVGGYELQGFIGALAPAATPPDVIARLGTTLVEIMNIPGVRKRIEDMALTAVGSDPERFRMRIANDIDKFSRLARASGASVR